MDLTRGPIRRHLLTMAIPASTGFLFNTLFNVIDTYWGGAISTDALAALSLSFPVFMIMLAIAQGISSGASALIANAIGSGDGERGRDIQAQAIEIGVVAALLFTVPIIVSLRTVFRFMGADESLMDTALRYSTVLVGGSVFFILNMSFNAGLTARGDTRSYRNFLIIGFLLNIGLDPLLLFGFSVGDRVVIPALAETGIAVATILIQVVGAVYLFRRMVVMNSLGEENRLRRFRIRLDLWGEIISQGVPAALNMAAIALGTFVITFFVARFGTDAIAAYGSALRIEQIALVPTIGLNIALAAMVGQNNGAGHLSRVRESYTTSLRLGLLIMVIILTPVLVFGRSLIRLFTDNPHVVSIGIRYLYIQGLTFFSYILMNQSNAVLQGVKRPGMIMWIGLYRQIAAPFVVFPLLTSIEALGVSGVWWGLVVVNWSAALYTRHHAMKVLDSLHPADT